MTPAARALFYSHMLRNGYRLGEFLSISSIITMPPISSSTT